MAVVDISTPLPQIELGPGASIVVDTGVPTDVITELVVYGMYYGPSNPQPSGSPLFVPVPVEPAS
jgi:hypothetical protein